MADENIIEQVKQRIDTLSQQSHFNTTPIIQGIGMIQDDKLKGELLKQLLDVAEQVAVSREGIARTYIEMEIEQIKSTIKINELTNGSTIKINELTSEYALEQDRSVRAIFSNIRLIVALWLLPIILGTLIVYLLNSFAYGVFCIICLYAILLSFYFHKATNFANVWRVFLNRDRPN